MTRISIVLGTRPEIIKLSPIIRLVNKKNVNVIFSGQHYDYDLGLRFIEDLGLQKPDFKMKLSRTNKIGDTLDAVIAPQFPAA